ncbi:MAG: MFS transporter [Pseudonocardiales bacterium]
MTHPSVHASSATDQVQRRGLWAAPAVIIAILALGALLVMSQLYMTIPLLEETAQRYTVSTDATAWVGLAFGLGFAIGNLVFVPFAERIDRRRLMGIGLIGVAATAAAASAVPNLPALVVTRGLGGFFAAAFPPLALAYIAHTLPRRVVPIGLAMVSSCFLLAGIVGQAYGLASNWLFGWEWVFLLPVPIFVLLAGAVLALPAGATHPTSEPFLTRLVGLTRNPVLLAAYAVAITLLLALVAMYSGLSGAVALRSEPIGALGALLLRLPGLPGVLLGAFAGPAIRRYGAHRMGAVALSVAATGLALEALAGSLWLLMIGSAIFMAGLGVAVASIVAVVSEAGAAVRGAALSANGFFIGVGASLAPLLVVAFDGQFAALCGLLAVIMLAAAATLGLGPRTAHSDSVISIDLNRIRSIRKPIVTGTLLTVIVLGVAGSMAYWTVSRKAHIPVTDLVMVSDGQGMRDGGQATIQIPGEPPPRRRLALILTLTNLARVGDCVNPARLDIAPVIDGQQWPSVDGLQSGRETRLNFTGATRRTDVVVTLHMPDPSCAVDLNVDRAILYD